MDTRVNDMSSGGSAKIPPNLKAELRMFYSLHGHPGRIALREFEIEQFAELNAEIMDPEKIKDLTRRPLILLPVKGNPHIHPFCCPQCGTLMTS